MELTAELNSENDKSLVQRPVFQTIDNVSVLLAFLLFYYQLISFCNSDINWFYAISVKYFVSYNFDYDTIGLKGS